jgi:hypothetical protein
MRNVFNYEVETPSHSVLSIAERAPCSSEGTQLISDHVTSEHVYWGQRASTTWTGLSASLTAFCTACPIISGRCASCWGNCNWWMLRDLWGSGHVTEDNHNNRRSKSKRGPSKYRPDSLSKLAICWFVALCSLVEVYRSFIGAFCLHHQGLSPSWWKQQASNVGNVFSHFTQMKCRNRNSFCSSLALD